ncbi:MAG: hypothetical protein EOP06_18005 [Proteobacteria bacterium]|nr:MAG: hypothetical protein EOP06_18005 [Pseudomonadota bacterium]
MKRWRLLLLAIPLIAFAFYLRSATSWRPRKVFTGAGPISHFVFSGDGKMLLVEHATLGMMQTSAWSSPLTIVTALDTQQEFRPLWQRNEGLPGGEITTQFFAADSKILAYFSGIQTLDARTGKTLKDYGRLTGDAVMSPDGKWLLFRSLRRIYPHERLYINPRLIGHRIYKLSAEKIFESKDAASFDLSFSPDGKQLVIGELGKIWGVSSQQTTNLRCRITSNQGCLLLQLDFSADQKRSLERITQTSARKS